MKDNTAITKLSDNHKHDIRVLVIAESSRQRMAFSDTIRSCGFMLVDCLSRDQLPDNPAWLGTTIDVWLIDSDYDETISKVVTGSSSRAVLVGFSQAPYLNDTHSYAKWQRTLKRKLAYLLNMPALIAPTPVFDLTVPRVPETPWRYVVLLGASMGGPTAIKAFLDHLSSDLPICILLAHHFSGDMIDSLPRILNRNNHWQCRVITTSQRLRQGQCLIVPTHRQIVCDSAGRVIVSDQPWLGDYKPSISQMIKNASDVYGSELISIVFSGMGNDGSHFLDSIQDNHSQLWAQDPRLSACSSQPQAIIDSGYCQFIGSPEALAQRLTDYVSQSDKIAPDPTFYRHQ